MSKYNIRKYNREGKNCCSICKQKCKLVCHHINGRNIPRYDEIWNHAWICPNCHDLIHDGQIIIETKQLGEIIWHYKDDKSITGIETTPHIY